MRAGWVDLRDTRTSGVAQLDALALLADGKTLVAPFPPQDATWNPTWGPYGGANIPPCALKRECREGDPVCGNCSNTTDMAPLTLSSRKVSGPRRPTWCSCCCNCCCNCCCSYNW